MLFAFIICLLFTIGDVDKVTASLNTTGLPLIEVFYEATKSKHATNFLVSMPAIVLFFTIFNVFASVSRLIWTFAKDKGLPFAHQFAYVSSLPHRDGAISRALLLMHFLLGSPYSPATTQRSHPCLLHQCLA